MRKLMISLLLVGTAAMPALAQDRDGGRRDRGSQSAQSDDNKRDRSARRAQRAERADRADRPQRTERGERQRPALEAARERVADRVRARQDDGAATATEAPRRPWQAGSADRDEQRQTRRDRNEDSLPGQLIEMRRSQREAGVEVHRDRPTTRDRDGNRDRDRDRDRVRRDRDGDRQWASHWRSDRRYDWRRHREHNRSIFRIGRYYDPYGYRYRRFSIGFNLWPSYYGSSYWLNDPWQYRLPPAYGPYRWVRYYDDALLVNIYNGRVVDVIHNFFW